MTSFDYLNNLNPPDERIRVVVSRHWDRPEITVQVNRQHIALYANIGDFVNAVLAEIGSPTLILTKKQLRMKVEKAVNEALEKVKEASAQVM